MKKPRLAESRPRLGCLNAPRRWQDTASERRCRIWKRIELAPDCRGLARLKAWRSAAAVTLQHLNTRLALGQEIDLGQYAQTVSAMVRVASRLGLRRRARDLTPSLSDLLREDQARQQAAANCGVANG